MPALRYLKPKDILYRTDDPIERLWKIQSGSILLQKITPAGQLQILDILGPGDFVNLSPSGLHTHEAQAFSDVTLSVHQLGQLASQEQAELLDQALVRVNHYQDQSVCIARDQAPQRLRHVLKLIAEKFQDGSAPVARDALTIPKGALLTRQQMADFTGLTLETVSRIFSEWKRVGWIVEERGRYMEVSRSLLAYAA